MALVSQLLGPDPSVGELGQKIAERAAGNPFFAEEMVRELAERGVLQGQTGAYVSTGGASEATVPATVQATIAAPVRAIRNRRLHHESQQPTVAIPSIAKRAQQLDSNFRAAAGRSGRRRQLEGFIASREMCGRT
jgi:hypothetical protein